MHDKLLANQHCQHFRQKKWIPMRRQLYWWENFEIHTSKCFKKNGQIRPQVEPAKDDKAKKEELKGYQDGGSETNPNLQLMMA